MGNFLGAMLGGVAKGYKDTDEYLTEKAIKEARFAREKKDWADEDALDRAINDTTVAGGKKFNKDEVYKGDQGAVLRAQDAAFGDDGTAKTAAALNTAQGAPQLQRTQTQTGESYLDDLQGNMRAGGVSAKRQFQTIAQAGQAAKVPYEMKALARQDRQQMTMDSVLEDARTQFAALNSKDPKVRLAAAQKLADEHSNDNEWGGTGTSKVLVDPATGVLNIALTGKDGKVAMHELNAKTAGEIIKSRLSRQLAMVSVEQFDKAADRDIKDRTAGAAEKSADAAMEHYGKGGSAERIAAGNNRTSIQVAGIHAAAGREKDKTQTPEAKAALTEVNGAYDKLQAAIDGGDKKAAGAARRAYDAAITKYSTAIGKPRVMGAAGDEKDGKGEWKVSNDGAFRTNNDGTVQDWVPPGKDTPGRWATRGMPPVSQAAAQAGVRGGVDKQGNPIYQGGDGKFYTTEQEAMRPAVKHVADVTSRVAKLVDSDPQLQALATRTRQAVAEAIRQNQPAKAAQFQAQFDAIKQDRMQKYMQQSQEYAAQE